WRRRADPTSAPNVGAGLAPARRRIHDRNLIADGVATLCRALPALVRFEPLRLRPLRPPRQAHPPSTRGRLLAVQAADLGAHRGELLLHLLQLLVDLVHGGGLPLRAGERLLDAPLQ